MSDDPTPRPGKTLALTSAALGVASWILVLLTGVCVIFTAGVAAVAMPLWIAGFVGAFLSGRAALRIEGLHPDDRVRATLGRAVGLGGLGLFGGTLALGTVIVGGTAAVMYGLRAFGVIEF